MSVLKNMKETKFLTELEKLRDGLEELLEDEDFAEAFDGMEEDEDEGIFSTPIALKRLPHGADLELPAYATPGSAGADLCAALQEPLTLHPGERYAVPTGIAIALPSGFEAQIRTRSGLAIKHGLVVLNSPGTIDPDYRGEIQVILINHGTDVFTITHGMRIAQLVIAPIIQAEWQVEDTLPDSTRGSKGLGSTGM